MAVLHYLLTGWHQFLSIIQATGLTESEWDRLRNAIDCVDACDVHNVLRQRNRLEWPEWHLAIDENDKAIDITKNFHNELEKSKLSLSVAKKIDIISETFLRFMPVNGDWPKVRESFQKAREEDNPKPILKAYISCQDFSRRINTHSAANTYHALKLYCTLVNCPVLAQTQEYTEAMTSLLFHPKLDGLLVRNRTVYRGVYLNDEKLIASYKKDAIIITTTLVSTSAAREVAEAFADDPTRDKISVISTYNIRNFRRHTALDISGEGQFPDEEEILILRYVPFKIRSIERRNNGRSISICFEECEDD